MENGEHHLVFGAVLVLLGRIVWDWLQSRKRNGNGDCKDSYNLTCQATHVDEVLRDIQDRQKKMWEMLIEIHEHRKRDDG